MTAKQLKLFELFLVVFVAFAASLIISINYIITGDKIEHVDQIVTIVRNIVHTLLSIFLLIYVLHRNNKTLKDIGIKYNISLKDSMGVIGMIFLIIIIQFLLASLMKHFFSGSAHQMTSPKNVDFLQTRYIGLMLIFVIFAPALEELVVRGYLITEIISFTNNKVLAVIVSVVFQTS